MDKDNVMTPHNPLQDPTRCDALAHPGDVAALRAPTVTHADKPFTEQGFIDHDDVTQDGEPSEPGVPVMLELPPPGVPAVPCDREPRCSLNANHGGPCLPPPEFTPGQARFATHEAACELVRKAVILPAMPPSWLATREVHRGLRAAQNLVHVWADVGDELLGELTHAQPGLHAAVMNVSGFAAQAAEAVDRHVSLAPQWAATFEAIVSEASKHKAYRMMGLAAGALLAGPFTVTWDNAVEWCLAYWGSPR